MKSIFWEKYKLINIALLGLTLFAFAFVQLNYSRWFVDADIDYIYKVFDGIYHPILVISKWFVGILAVLLFFPSHVFKKWLFFVLPIPLIVTIILIVNISVYSSGVLYISRAQMAKNGMFVLAIITALFIVGCLIYFRKKKIRN
jgi:hypothetical protein